MEGLCTGSGWRGDSLHLELRGGKKTLQPIAPGDKIELVVGSDRMCIGYRPPDGESLLPCPDQAKSGGSSQCASCFEKAVILPCLRCDGERCRNPERRENCVQPDNHAVYLAAFGDGLLKVGVARWNRRKERVREQGSLAAFVVAREDGQIARRVEAAVCRLGVPDRLSPTAKLAALPGAPKTKLMEKEILDALEGLRYRIRANWLEEPEAINLPKPDVSAVPDLLRPEKGLVVRGKVSEVVGQMIVLRPETGALQAIEASSLVGFSLRPPKEDEMGTGQMSLAFSS